MRRSLPRVSGLRLPGLRVFHQARRRLIAGVQALVVDLPSEIKGIFMDADSTISVLMQIHKDQTAIANSLWAIYQGVSLAMLGYVFSQDFARKSPWVLGFLTASYIFFSLANQRAISRSQELIVAASHELNVVAELPTTGVHMRAVLSTYDALPVSTLEFGHHAFSLLVVFAFWVLFAVSRFQSKPKIL